MTQIREWVHGGFSFETKTNNFYGLLFLSCVGFTGRVCSLIFMRKF